MAERFLIFRVQDGNLISQPLARVWRQSSRVSRPANRRIGLSSIQLFIARDKRFSQNDPDHHTHLQGKRKRKHRQNNQCPEHYNCDYTQFCPPQRNRLARPICLVTLPTIENKGS